MSDIRTYFEHWYREHHNVPTDIKFTHRGNEYLEHEVQTAWSAFCEGWHLSQRFEEDFRKFAEVADGFC